MKTKIEFGKITGAPLGFGFRRMMSIIETDAVTIGRVEVQTYIHADTKEDLEIIDYENFMEE